MAVVALEFSNDYWGWGRDSNQGIDGTRKIQAIHVASGANPTPIGWVIQNDSGTEYIWQSSMGDYESRFIEFDPPLVVEDFKMGADPGGDLQFFVFFAPDA